MDDEERKSLLRRLKKRHRRVLRLRCQGMTYPKIAAETERLASKDEPPIAKDYIKTHIMPEVYHLLEIQSHEDGRRRDFDLYEFCKVFQWMPEETFMDQPEPLKDALIPIMALIRSESDDDVWSERIQHGLRPWRHLDVQPLADAMEGSQVVPWTETAPNPDPGTTDGQFRVIGPGWREWFRRLQGPIATVLLTLITASLAVAILVPRLTPTSVGSTAELRTTSVPATIAAPNPTSQPPPPTRVPEPPSVFRPPSAVNTWEQVGIAALDPQPQARAGHRVAWDPETAQMFIFGGRDKADKYLNDLWSYKPQTNTWTQLATSGSKPAARTDPSLVWDPVNRQLLLYAGHDYNVMRDLWSYKPEADRWQQLSPEAPLPNYRQGGHGAVWNPIDEEMLIVGGWGDRALGDLWAYQPRTNRWTQLPTMPGTRRGGAAAAVWADGRGEMLVLSDGTGLGGSRAELWSYKPQTKIWAQLPSSGPRPSVGELGALVWDPIRDQALWFGGGYKGTTDETWSYQPEKSAWTKLQPGPYRGDLPGIWDTMNNQMIMFGGRNVNDVFNNVMIYHP